MLAVVAVTVFVFFFGNRATSDALAKGILRGDVNKNGKLDTEDVNLILRTVYGNLRLTTEQKLLADLDGDGKITRNDAQRLLEIIRKAGSDSSE